MRDTLLFTETWKLSKLRMARLFLAELHGDAIAGKKESRMLAITTPPEAIGIRKPRNGLELSLLGQVLIQDDEKNT
jgi:hypothetical protein